MVHTKHDGSRDKEYRDATLALVTGSGTLADNNDGEILGMSICGVGWSLASKPGATLELPTQASIEFASQAPVLRCTVLVNGRIRYVVSKGHSCKISGHDAAELLF